MSMTKQQRKPRYRRAPDAGVRLQARDRQIISQVFKHRFLSSEHIAALVGGSEQGIRRRLHLLFHHGYLDRPPEQIRPYKQGSEPMVYGLGNKGADLLAAEGGVPRAKVDWTSKNREMKSAHLAHTLLVAHFMVTLELACRARADVELWDQAKVLAGAKMNGIPSWKVAIPVAAGNQERQAVVSVVPDKVFGLYFPEDPPGRNQAFFFLEADRSTMPVVRSNILKSSFAKKLTSYWTSWRQGLFAKHFGFKNARILTLTKSQERIESMIAAGRGVDDRGKGSKMFLFAQESAFGLATPGRLLDKIWQNGRDDERVSLLD